MTVRAAGKRPHRPGGTSETARLRARLQEAEDVLNALAHGQIDALVRPAAPGAQVFTLTGAERPYRALVETMSEGAVTLGATGAILYSNRRFAEMLGRKLEEIIGAPLHSLVPPDSVDCLEALRAQGRDKRAQERIDLVRADGTRQPSLLAIAPLADHDGDLVLVATDLTELTEAERAARKNEERYRRFLEGLNDGVVAVNATPVITYANAQFARMLGYPVQDLVGRPSFEFMEDSGRERATAALERRRRGVAERYELSWRRRDGSPLQTLISATPILGEGHRFEGSISVITDLTELKQAESQRDQLARIVEGAGDAILAKDLDGVIRSWNQGAERLYGYTAAEVIGRNVSVLAPPERVHETDDLVARMQRGEAIGHYETERISKAGKRIHVSISLSPLRDAAGRLTGVSAVARDITRRVVAENAAREAGAYNRSLIEASLDPLVTVSVEGKITDVNEATVKATGVPRKQLIGGDFAEYFTDPAKARAGYREAFEKGSVRNFPLTLRHRSGGTMEVLYNAAVYRDTAGAVAGVFAAARDITERKRAESELERYRQHLEELVEARTGELAAANADLQAFAYSVSHDLRAPLRAVDGFSQILLEDYGTSLDAEGRRVVGVIRDGARKMGRMIDDILAYSRAGRLDLSAVAVDMESLVRAAIAELLAARPGNAPSIEVGKLPPARADEAMIQRVWTNLIDNAIKYSAPNSEPRIEVGATATADETIYFVRDNGVGFDMQYADKLFGVFQRLHGAEFPGTGIGLAIVKRIVDRHGGRVWAQAKPNEGATFYFALPNSDQAGA